MHSAILTELLEVEKQNDITVFNCKGVSKTCAVNPFNNYKTCTLCIKHTNHMESKIYHSQVKVVSIQSLTRIESDLEKEIDNIINLDKLKSFKFEEIEVGRIVVHNILCNNRDLEFDLTKDIQNARNLIKNFIQIYKFFCSKLLEDFEKVYLWGGRRVPEQAFRYAALKMNLPIEYFEAGSSKIKYRLTPYYFFDYNDLNSEIQNDIAKLSQFEKDEWVRSGIQLSLDFQSGVSEIPDYVNFQQQTDITYSQEKISSIKHSSKPIITIFTSTFWEFSEYENLNILENEFTDMYSTIENILSDAELNLQYQLVVRWHPNLRNAGAIENSRVKKIINNFDNTIHFEPSSLMNSYKLLEVSEKVIVFGSTIGLESISMGKEVLLLGRSSYENIPGLPRPRTLSELKNELLHVTGSEINLTESLLTLGWFANFGIPFKRVIYRNRHYFIDGKRIARKFTANNLKKYLNWKLKIRAKKIRT